MASDQCNDYHTVRRNPYCYNYKNGMYDNACIDDGEEGNADFYNKDMLSE